MTKSEKARKQRKSQYNAPHHRKRKMIASHLDSPLRKEYGRRAIPVVKGDTVLVIRGEEDTVGTEGRVASVDTDKGTVIIDGVTMAKADGTQIGRPVHASNLIITKLNLEDAWRKERLMRKEGA